MNSAGEVWREALRASPLPLFLHAEDGELILTSRSLGEATGYDPDGFASVGEWAAVAYGDEAERVKEGIARLFTLESAVREGEFKVRDRDGASRVWDFSSAPAGTLPDGRRMILSIATDVTSRADAEAEIRRLNGTLEERVSARTADVEEAYTELEAFAYSVSHDLRAPLRAVNGYAEILLEEHGRGLDQRGRELAAGIARAANDMATLVDDLLMFARAGTRAPRIAAVDMEELVAACYAEVRAGHPEFRGHLVVGPLPYALGDRALLVQVVSNLLDNALKYSSRRDDARVDVTGHATDLACTYTFRDNGVGFDPAFAQRMFGVFERLHGEDFPGTGIGLAIAQRVVQRHRGRIWAWGGPGEGAEISFSLPLGGA